jgi:hypothetical protein
MQNVGGRSPVPYSDGLLRGLVANGEWSQGEAAESIVLLNIRPREGPFAGSLFVRKKKAPRRGCGGFPYSYSARLSREGGGPRRCCVRINVARPIGFQKALAEASALIMSCDTGTLPPAPTAIEAAAEYQQHKQEDDYQGGIIHRVLP